MRPPSRFIGTTAVALLVASAIVVGQRSSPQFSFPPPNGDLFSSNGQDLGPSNQQLGQQQSSSQQQSQGNEPSQFISQPIPQQSQQQSQQSAQQSSIASLSSTQRQPSQQQQQQPQQQPQQQRPLASNVQASTQQLQPSSSRHRAQSQTGAPVHSPVPPTAQSSRHPANMQFQSHTSGSNSNQQQSQQASIDAARKAEASAASIAASSGQSYHCPDSFGYFRHHKSCDKYWACDNGTATLKLCGNGLMFDDSDPRRENCAYPFSVDCGSDRTDVEAPISTPHCPRLYGLFPDTGNCRVFYSCWNGEASRYECPAGLAYDNEHRVCVWADHVDRCDQSEVSDGFVCPDPTEADQPGHYTRHAHPTDCRKFYVCIEGVARPYGCSIGTVFNVDSLQCDEPDNVSGCEKYYGDMDPKLAKKLARENVQQSSGAAPSRTQHSSPSSSSSSSSSRVVSSSSSQNQASQASS